MTGIIITHLNQWVMTDIIITLHPLLVSCYRPKTYILFFFSETTRPVGIRLGRNVHWMVLYKWQFNWTFLKELLPLWLAIFHQNEYCKPLI
jgi:hypothetical protein